MSAQEAAWGEASALIVQRPPAARSPALRRCSHAAVSSSAATSFPER